MRSAPRLATRTRTARSPSSPSECGLSFFPPLKEAESPHSSRSISGRPSLRESGVLLLEQVLGSLVGGLLLAAPALRFALCRHSLNLQGYVPRCQATCPPTLGEPSRSAPEPPGRLPSSGGRAPRPGSAPVAPALPSHRARGHSLWSLHQYTGVRTGDVSP